MISINAWMDKDGKEYEILYNQKTQDTAQAFSFLKNTSLQCGCYPVVGMEVDFTNKFFEIEHFLFVGFELLFRFEEFGQDYNGLSVSVDSLIEFSQNVSTTFPGCKFFFQDCRFPTGRYTNRHQFVCMLPWDIREEIRDVSELVVFAFKKEFPFWNWRKGEAIERIIVKKGDKQNMEGGKRNRAYNVPNIHESLARDVAAGVLTLHDAAVELASAGWNLGIVSDDFAAKVLAPYLSSRKA